MQTKPETNGKTTPRLGPEPDARLVAIAEHAKGLLAAIDTMKHHASALHRADPDNRLRLREVLGGIEEMADASDAAIGRATLDTLLSDEKVRALIGQE